MKKKAKTLGLLLAVAVMISGCQYFPFLKKEGAFTYDVEKTEGVVVIKVENVEGEGYLSTLMEDAKAKDLLQFECSGGMIISLEGVENAADWSACWMLYTTDEEMSNNAWGTFEYEEETLGSAILGMDSLRVEDGESYVWVYQSF